MGGREFLNHSDTLWPEGIGYNTDSDTRITDGDTSSKINDQDRKKWLTPKMQNIGLPDGVFNVILHFADIWSGAHFSGAQVCDVLIQGVTIASC